MKKQRFNLGSEAWRNLVRSWRPAPSPGLIWQSRVVGPLLSQLARTPSAAAAAAQAQGRLDRTLVIAGYWRSGTTLMHELTAAAGGWSFPTTYACMNPHAFLSGAPAPESRGRRPMDDMPVSSDSPQEDEFALLNLGARSPYEACLFPRHLKEALRLCDPARLTADESGNWIRLFQTFCRAVSGTQQGQPLLLKSPPHGCRIPLIRRALPGSKFVVIVRNPYHVFESTVRMWRLMSELYALTPLPPEDEIREAVLEHRPDYERCLQSGLQTLGENEFAIVRYEDLVRDPGAVVSAVYRRLELAGAEEAAENAAREAASRSGFAPRARLPDEAWARKLKSAWAELFERYGYPS